MGTVGNITIENAFSVDCPNMGYLWGHTYGAGLLKGSESSRLKELSPQCVELKGTIYGTSEVDKKEADGDLKFTVVPDSNYKHLLEKSGKNCGPSPKPCRMVVEIICWEQPDYKKYDGYTPHEFCKGVESKKHFPNVQNLKSGDSVCIIGKWVQDIGYPQADHPEWNEIHPAERLC